MAPLFGSNSILGSVSHWRGQQVLPSHRAPFFVTCRSWQFRRKGVLHDRYCQETSPCVLKQTYPPICAKRRGIGPVSVLLSSETTYGGPSLGMWDIGVLYTWVPINFLGRRPTAGFSHATQWLSLGKFWGPSGCLQVLDEMRRAGDGVFWRHSNVSIGAAWKRLNPPV